MKRSEHLLTTRAKQDHVIDGLVSARVELDDEVPAIVDLTRTPPGDCEERPHQWSFVSEAHRP
ncbi:MAG TPA: hypothetical protein VE800_04945, partial [Actinomycetota bacterium]|nr:hypothetical protein [Actinomycetota bacterium]